MVYTVEMRSDHASEAKRASRSGGAKAKLAKQIRAKEARWHEGANRVL